MSLDLNPARSRACVPRTRCRATSWRRASLAFTPFVYEDVGDLITQSNDDLYLFSSDYPHFEGGRNPLGRFAKSLEGYPEQSLERFYSQNFGRLFGL